MTTSSLQMLQKKIVDCFLCDPNAGLFNRKKVVGDFQYEEFTAAYTLPDGKRAYGHGQSEIKNEALLKSICENYERQAMLRFFAENACESFSLADPFHYKALRTSNGWAIHTDEALALKAARLEALERHILTLSYLKYGWLGFSKVNEIAIGATNYISLVSRYSCEGVGAAIVVAKDEECAGVSFGYFCDSTENMLTSPKWRHALFEAKGALDGSKDKSQLPTKPALIKRAVINYLHSDWTEPRFSVFEGFSDLPPVNPITHTEIFRDSCDNELFIVSVRGGGLIPLFFPVEIDSAAQKFVGEILASYGVHKITKEPMPVL